MWRELGEEYNTYLGNIVRHKQGFGNMKTDIHLLKALLKLPLECDLA